MWYAQGEMHSLDEVMEGDHMEEEGDK